MLYLVMKLNRIKLMLVEKDKSNKWLSEHIGKSPVTISRWVTNEVQPTIQDLNKIAELLNVDVRELLVSNKEEKNL